MWPLNGHSLEAHPIAQLAPHLVPELQQHVPAIVETLQFTDGVLSHADLHGEHIFVRGSRLTGLIDFGAAFIGKRSWDFASLAFYHGWEAAEWAIEAYAANLDAQRQGKVEAAEIALLLAMYKLDKASTDNAQKAKIDRIVSFIELTLSHRNLKH